MKWRKAIVAPHMMHRPRSPRYARIGMFAHHGIGRLHCRQNERGVTIEISRGNRYAITLTKLPTLAPKANATSARQASREYQSHRVTATCSSPPALRAARSRSRAIARPVEFRKHHALPASERKLAAADRDVDRGAIASRTEYAPASCLHHDDKPFSRGTILSSCMIISVVTSGSQFSETITARWYAVTKRLQSPLSAPVSATARFTFIGDIDQRDARIGMKLEFLHT